MERAKITRRLRITASALCLLFCAALVGLWIRSYSWSDYAHCPLPGKSINPTQRITVRLSDGTEFEPSPRMLHAGSFQGRLSLYVGEYNPTRSGWFSYGWGMHSTSAMNYTLPSNNDPLSWQFSSDRYGRSILFPLWFPALVFGALAVAFGIRAPYRFSLRTLLIATTLVAVILGAVVVASR